MNRVKLIKACQFLYECSKSGIMGCGIVMTLVLALISSAKLQGVETSAEVSFSEITSGWYSYLWIGLIDIYVIGLFVIIFKRIRRSKNEKKYKSDTI